MARWNLSTSESGILRKKQHKDKHEDLLVFGYACKIFRDDEKALYIDQGKHLIPWMGEDSLRIDRYDCRGALSELVQYEVNREDYNTTRWLGLSESERHIEVLCDEERYYALKHNEEELEMYKEEELKRLHQKGSEVQYNYDVPVDPDNSQEAPDSVELEDEIFVPLPELDVPVDIQVPKTVKENTRIEKTALFISKQGPQMEILIKTKQADNPQFSFMNKDDQLYNYYKHLLEAIKSGRYKVQSQNTNEEQKTEDSSELDTQEDHYLHPSLLTTSLQSAPPPLPTVAYKPSADCTYSQLVNRIQGTQSESPTPPPQPPIPDISQQMTYEQQQYYQQYYYAAQYYEYYKQMAQQFQGQSSDQSQDKIPTETFVQNQIYASAQNFLQSQAVYTQYFQQQSTNPYAQIVSNLAHKDIATTYSGFAQDVNQSAQNTDITKAPIIYKQNESEVDNTQPVQTNSTKTTKVTEEKHPIKKPLLFIAEYGSDSENEGLDEGSDLKVPPTETQQIIDKMASYVTKNGKDFETIVQSKGDPRFDFLNENHEYHSYYRRKVKEYLNQISSKNENANVNDSKEQFNGVSPKLKEKKVITPVSFSIKKPKEEMSKEIKSALPIEESDEDQDENVPSKTPPMTIQNVVVSTLPVTTSNLVEPASLTPPPRVPITTSPIQNDLENEETGDKNLMENEEIKNHLADADELIMEMIDLTDDLEERRENKRAEDRKKDKIAAAAREKLALQLERKKKAEAFLKLKSVETKPDEDKSDRSKRKHSESHTSSSKKKILKTKEKPEEVLKIENSELEEGEIKKHRKTVKRKKSHKCKHSRSSHESRGRHKIKEHKKSKKRRRRSQSCNSQSSATSQ